MSQDLAESTHPSHSARSQLKLQQRPARAIRFGHIHADAVTAADAIDRIVDRVRSGEGGYVVTPNVDHVCLAEHDAELRAAYRDAFLSIPDGKPLLWIASWLGTPLPEKVSGSDLILPLLRRAADEGLTVFFLGSTEATCAAAARNLAAQCPGLRIGGWASPVFDPAGDPTDVEEALEKVSAAHPDLLLVAMGCPKQEYLLWRYLEAYAPAVGVGVGGSLEFAAGSVRRAPRWVSDHGLEWLFRLAQEPGRLWRRYLVRDRHIVRIAWRMRREANRERVESV